MKNKNMKWFFLGLAILLMFATDEGTSKRSVADVEGNYCLNETQCPCWGTYNVTGYPTEDAYGFGTGRCIENKCDTTYCLDVEPVGVWLRDNPWQWIKNNILIVLLIIGLLVMAARWPIY